MSKTIGRFDHEVTKMGKGDSLPFDPFVLLCLSTHGRTTRDGAPSVSSNLMTEQEIDDYVALLKVDLDAVGVVAKRALKSARSQTMLLVSKRTPG